MKKKTMKLLAAGMGISFTCIFALSGCGWFRWLTSSDDRTTDPPAEYPLYEAEKFWDRGDEAENEKFTSLTARFFKESLQNDILSLHSLVKDLEAYGFTERPQMNLTAATTIDYQGFLDELETVEYASLSRENRITYDVMKEDLSEALTTSVPPIESYFDYMSGIQTSLISLAADYEFFVEQDVDDYLDLLEQIPEYFDLLYREEEKRVQAGYGLADFVVEDVIDQFESVYNEGENSCLFSAFSEKVNELDFLSAAQKSAYVERNGRAVRDDVFTAYRETSEKLSALKGRGNADGAICSYENGKEYYVYLMKSRCGYGGTPEELYRALDAFIEEQQESVNELLVDMGSYNAYIKWVNGGAKGLTTAEATLDYFAENLTGYFPALPETTYTVKYLSESMANAMPNVLAYYSTPQLDHYTNGQITVNGYAADEGGLMNTVAHEGYPGHMYQYVYYYSRNPDPARSLFSFLGYTEGWAVYAANQAEYIYRYPENDYMYTKLNELNVNLNYALLALADIGVNYYGYTAKQVGEMLGYTGSEAVSAGEEVRTLLIEMPGAYLSYGAGNMMMYSLRSYAEKREGDSFDLLGFHKFVLDMGPCNFDLLQQLEKEYYDIKLGKTTQGGLTF